MRLCGTEDMSTCPGGLRARQRELEAQIAEDQKRADDSVRFNEGILAQINALHKISSMEGNTTGWLVHTSVMLFFFMIEILPVLVKTMVALGNDHQYDDVTTRMRQAELVAAHADYDSESLRISNQESKRVAIENDMVQREIDLGKLANEHVQNEMKTILKKALEQWSIDLQATMAANPPEPGTTQSTQQNDPHGLNAKGSRI